MWMYDNCRKFEVFLGCGGRGGGGAGGSELDERLEGGRRRRRTGLISAS